MNNRHAICLMAIVLAVSLFCGGCGEAEHDEHDGHDHSAHAVNSQNAFEPAARGLHREDQEGNEEDHEDEDASAVAGKGHAERDEHDEEGEALSLSEQERHNAGIVVAEATSGDLASEIVLPGEVVLNRDDVVHVVPQVSGVAADIVVTEGDKVAKGQVVATLASSELGAAKLDYLTQVNEIACCDTLVPRARAVHDSTMRLLDFLDGSPTLSQLQGFSGGEAGQHLAVLLGAYAEHVNARRAFAREESLHQKEVTSEQEYLQSKTAHEKAAADYRSARDSAAFEVRQELFEAEAELRAARFVARTAEQRLRIMGLSEGDIHELEELVQPQEACTEADCTDCASSGAGKDEDHGFGNGFTTYEIRSPLAGRIIERHLSKGEQVGQESDLFTIADTGTVWVELTVYLKDIHLLQVGQEVVIRAEHSGRTTRGRISTLLPTVNEATRTGIARLVIDNADGTWLPGVFVVGRVSLDSHRPPVVVPKNAVQTLEDRQVVFMPDGDAFRPVDVQTGRMDGERIEITSGLSPGARFVSQGAFELKAKLITSSLDSHAGHGH